MTSKQQADHDQIVRICRGNAEALDWTQLGRLYVHEIDDLIDIDIPAADRATGAERACKIGAMAIALYTHPFFLRHSDVLAEAMRNCTNLYADSVRWENGPASEWRREFSDWGRHSWIQVILTVAGICGGYQHMRAESEALWEMAYADHHNEKGQAI